MFLEVYYLDDEVDLLELFTDIFASPEVRITTFSDPQKAEHAIQERAPDLLFLDQRLPGTTGDQIALRLDPAIPKVLITGDVIVKVEARFEAIFPKPFAIDQVRAIIEAHLARKRGQS
jgi:DNA-binding response OmpR family regulator